MSGFRGFGFGGGGGGISGVTLSQNQIGIGDASNKLSGSSKFTVDPTNNFVHIDGGNDAQGAIQITSGTGTGTSSSDGSFIGLEAGAPDLYIKQREASAGIFLSNPAGTGTVGAVGSLSAYLFWNDFSFGVRVQSANVQIDGPSVGRITVAAGGIGIAGVSSPLARVHIGAGSSSANTAPLKINTGTITTTAEAGAIEYNGNHYESKSNNIRYGKGGALTQNFTDAGNGTTVETDLYSYTSPANLFDTNGQKLEAKYAGIFANNAATKQLKAYFAGTAIFDSGALTITGSSSWELEILIIRVSSTVVRCTVKLNTSGASLSAYATYTELTSLTLSGTNILKITGTAGGGTGATNDIVAKLGSISFLANI